MELKLIKLTVTLFVGLIGVVHGKAIPEASFDELAASQQTLFRRDPNLFLQSLGYGGGYGDTPSGGMSTTSLQYNGENNPNSGLSVTSSAVGAGNGVNGGGGAAQTGLQFNTNGSPDSIPNNQGLSVQSTAVGGGNGPNGGGGAQTGLQFNNGGTCDGNPNNQGLSVQSTAVGGGNGLNGGASAAQTSLQFNNSGSPNDNLNNQGLSVQSTAVGGGNGPNGGGGAQTGLQFNNGGTCDGNHNQGLSVQSTAVGGGNGPNGGGGGAQTSLQFNNNNSCDGSHPDNTGLNVQSNAVGVGGGDNSTGASQTTLQTTNNTPPKPDQDTDKLATVDQPPKPDQDVDKLKVQNEAIGASNGNNAIGATHTTLESNNKDGDLKVDNTAVGVANGNQAMGLAGSEIHEADKDKTVDVSNTALGAGDEAGAATKTSIQEKDANGKDTNINTQSVGYGSGHNAVGATQTTVQVDKDTPAGTPVPLQNDDKPIPVQNVGVGQDTQAGTPVPLQNDDKTVQVQNVGVAQADKNGATGISANSVQIKDDKEGDIDLNTIAAGSSKNGGTGMSGVGVQISDGSDKTVNNDLAVKSTNTAVRSSEHGVGGSVSTVQVDDKKNERSLEAQTIGLGYKDDHSSGTLTADSMKYHDVDQENHTVISPDQNSVFQSSTHETNDISSQNMASQYSTVDDDGTHSSTTHSTTTQTHQTQVMQQSYVTQQQIINQQNQGYVVADQDQQVNHVVQNQQSQSLIQNEQSHSLIQNQQSQNLVHNDQSQSTILNQQSQNLVQNDQSQSTILNRQSQNLVQNEQSQSTLQNQSQMTSTQQTQSVDQSQSTSFGSHQILPYRHQASPMLCPDNNQGPGVVCHYEVASVFEYDNNYILRPTQIVTEYCDVLIVSYAVLDVEKLQIGAFSPDEERVFSEIASLRSDKLKIILQLQYVAFYEQYITILNCDDNLNRFTSSVINYLKKWNFDGIELPIMVPQSNDKFYETSPVVKEKFPILVQKLRSNLGDDHIISVCLPIEPDYIDFAYDIPKLLKYVNWFSVITLDYNVPDQGILQHSSPLTPQTSIDPYCIDFTVNYLLTDLNVPSDKLIINLPLYGTSFVVENYKNTNYGARVTGKGPKGPSSNVDGFLTISELCSLTQLNWLNSPAIVTDYDDIPTLVMKVTYARSKCLGGIGIHSISMDDPEGHLCAQGMMPFTRAISLAYDPTRDIFGANNDDLQLINYIDKSTTNKYEV